MHTDRDWDILSICENKLSYHPFFGSGVYRKALAIEFAKRIFSDEQYIAKVFNPSRMRSYKSIQELEDMRLDFGWSNVEMAKHI